MPEIIIYTTQFCSYCHRAKHLLERKKVQFREISIDHKPQLRSEMIEKSGRRSVPQIWIAGMHIGGYSELSQLEANGKLDKLIAD